MPNLKIFRQKPQTSSLRQVIETPDMISLDFLLLKFWEAEAEWTTKLRIHFVQWYSIYWIGLIWLKEMVSMGLSKSCQGCSKGFPVGEGQGKSRGTDLLHEENPVLLDSFTRIIIIFQIGFFIQLSKIVNIFRAESIFCKVNLGHFWCKISNFGSTFFRKNCVRNFFAVCCLLKDFFK